MPVHVAGGIDSQNAGNDGAVAGRIDDIALPQFQGDGVGVANGQISGHGAQALHPVMGDVKGGN